MLIASDTRRITSGRFRLQPSGGAQARPLKIPVSVGSIPPLGTNNLTESRLFSRPTIGSVSPTVLRASFAKHGPTRTYLRVSCILPRSAPFRSSAARHIAHARDGRRRRPRESKGARPAPSPRRPPAPARSCAASRALRRARTSASARHSASAFFSAGSSTKALPFSGDDDQFFHVRGG